MRLLDQRRITTRVMMFSTLLLILFSNSPSTHWPLVTSHSSLAYAAVPHLIRYQGQAVDSKGVPLEGPYTLTFRLYDAATAGTKIWEETQANVPLANGHFSVLLGQASSLGAVDWSKSLWLSIQVNTDPELSPRQSITSVPLAIRAERADTATTATLAQSAERLTQAITPSLITPQGSGSSLDADTVDGKHASDLLNRANHTGTQPASTITGTFPPSTVSPQGAGSGLDADTVDSKHAVDFAGATHKHSCSYRWNLPSGWSADTQCAQNNEWCIGTIAGGGHNILPCSSVNPGFGDWGSICCR